MERIKELENGSFLITKSKEGIRLIPKNIDAFEIVTICNKISISLCNEANISKFKMMKMFLTALFKNNMEISEHNFKERL